MPPFQTYLGSMRIAKALVKLYSIVQDFYLTDFRCMSVARRLSLSTAQAMEDAKSPPRLTLPYRAELHYKRTNVK